MGTLPNPPTKTHIGTHTQVHTRTHRLESQGRPRMAWHSARHSPSSLGRRDGSRTPWQCSVLARDVVTPEPAPEGRWKWCLWMWCHQIWLRAVAAS